MKECNVLSNYGTEACTLHYKAPLCLLTMLRDFKANCLSFTITVGPYYEHIRASSFDSEISCNAFGFLHFVSELSTRALAVRLSKGAVNKADGLHLLQRKSSGNSSSVMCPRTDVKVISTLTVDDVVAFEGTKREGIRYKKSKFRQYLSFPGR